MAAGRMLKESIRTSKTVNALSDFQFRLWAYLITYVDDYGRGSADPELLKGLVFPRRKGITESQIKDGLTVLANTGMITLYEVDGESYFYFPKWGEHQRIRAKWSQFPAPTKDAAATCGNPPQSAATCGNPPIEVEVEVEEEVEPEVEVEDSCAELQSTAALTLILNTGEEYPVTQDFVEQMQALYPAVDVMQELRAMKAWCISNPKKRKTARGIKAFINSWLSREQDKGGRKNNGGYRNYQQSSGSSKGQTDNIFLQMHDEEHGNDQR